MALYPEPLTVVARGRRRGDAASRISPASAWRSASRDRAPASIADALIAALGWTPASFAATPDLPPERVGQRALRRRDRRLLLRGRPAGAGDPGGDHRLRRGAGRRRRRRWSTSWCAEDPELRRRDDPGRASTAAPTARSRPSASARRWSPAPTCPTTPSTRSSAASSSDIDTLRGLDPVLAELDPAAMVADGLSAPLHPGGGPLLPRARLGPLVSPRFQPVASERPAEKRLTSRRRAGKGWRAPSRHGNRRRSGTGRQEGATA